LLAGAVAQSDTLYWARRVITRPEAAGGEPFVGVNRAGFDALQGAGEFALSWEAHGLCYGIRHAEFAPAAQGRDVVFNGSRGALALAKAAFPELIVLRISAPSRVLAERLAARGRETREDIEARLRRASYELPLEIPVIDVVNDATPEIGVARVLAALQAAKAGPVSA
jgi:phosphonate metabolism protein PhnN/1,5-bisphosphokinase (PRPP-forming)